MMKFSGVLFSILLFVLPCHATDSGSNRFGLNGGLVIVNEKTSFALSAEYEYRPTSFMGFGAQGSYVFATAAFTQIAAPMLFIHPLLGDWYMAAAPVFYLSSASNRVGTRFITRAPLIMDFLSLVPVLGVDLIEGGPNYILGLGISI